jgi:hypothetical protein
MAAAKVKAKLLRRLRVKAGADEFPPFGEVPHGAGQLDVVNVDDQEQAHFHMPEI